MKNSRVLFMTRAALTAACYVVLTVIFAPFGFGLMQVRIAEMLTVLPFFTAAAVPGLFIGCLIGNMLGGAPLPDIVFGSLATLAGALGTYMLRKRKLWLAPAAPIAANTVAVPLILRFAYGVKLAFPLIMLGIFTGELVSCGLMGLLLGRLLMGRRDVIFGGPGRTAAPAEENRAERSVPITVGYDKAKEEDDADGR